MLRTDGQTDRDRQTDRHGEANSRFSQFANASKGKEPKIYALSTSFLSDPRK
jgi:hypothetical protein